jgi:phospholipase C
MMLPRAAILTVSVAIISGCASGAVSAPGRAPNPTPPPARTPIKHIVIVIQENRTVDNLFNGFPGADTVKFGKTSKGTQVPLSPVSLASSLPDPCHTHLCWVTTYDGGQMDGFDKTNPPDAPPFYNYSFVPKSETVPLWDMAAKFSFAKRFFQSNSGPSFPAHQYLVAGQSNFADENPNDFDAPRWGCDAPPGTTVAVLDQNGKEHTGPFPCFTYTTLADAMDGRGVTWRYYAPQMDTSGYGWSAFDANQQIRFGPDWARNVISPETTFLTDVANGQLAQVTWIVPKGTNSDHPHSMSANGPQWVASIVNAIGTSQFWNETAIFITWDDSGGWYDHVPPPQLDVMGLGYRVPLIVVAPYARLHYVSPKLHEFGSLMKFAEEDFGIPPIGTSDARADDLADIFDFHQSPTPFTPIQTKIPPSFLINQPPSNEPPDTY